MSNKMLLNVRLDQRMAMSQQLTQAITLLQYNTLDLKQLVQQHLETNPLMELDEPEDNAEETELISDDEEDQSYLSQYSASIAKSSQYVDSEDESSLENVALPKSLSAFLLEQTLLCKFTLLEQAIAEAIIGCIDDDGRLLISIADLQKTVIAHEEPSLEQIAAVLERIHTFDPIGVGAKNLRECLLIQLAYFPKKDTVWKTAHQIISDHFDLISTKNAKKIIQRLELTHQDYTRALDLIRSLNPYPGREFEGTRDVHVEPELYVKKVKNKWRVFRVDSVLTHVKINKQYQALLKESKKQGPYEALNKELLEAQWLLKGLKRRNETLSLVASHIVEAQEEFLEKGPSAMKAMNIAEVAYACNLHESTISRITSGKYISTPKGIVELKYFFPSHVTMQTGEACSDTAVKEYIKAIISQESHGKVHSDEDIAQLLQQRGINIARRTVAKYREALKILPSYQRTNALFHVGVDEEDVCAI